MSWPSYPVKYDANGQSILDRNGSKVLDIRGWGYLTGGGGLKLEEKVASKMQDELGEKVTHWLNATQQQPIGRDYDPVSTVRSLSVMLGWVNVPPREVLERSVSAIRQRAEKAEEALLAWTGKKCEDTDCEDHDGNHPYHFNAVEKFWVKVQDSYLNRLKPGDSGVPGAAEWGKELKFAHERGARAESVELAVEQIKIEYDRVADAALPLISGAGIATPVEGYKEAPWALPDDLKKLSTLVSGCKKLLKRAKAGETITVQEAEALLEGFDE